MFRLLLIFIITISYLAPFANGLDTINTKIKKDTSYWKTETTTLIGFNQVYLDNWSAGGESSIAGKATIGYDADFKKENFIFDNDINIQYGLVGFKSKQIQKTDDKLDITSSIGWNASEKWYYSTQLNIKTQFTRGYKYPNDSVIVSKFFAPANSTLSLGMKYKPNDFLYLFLSPASGKFTFVLDNDLANKGSFGVTQAVVDTAGNIISKGKPYKAQFGINVIMKIKKEIIKNIKLQSKLNLYNNYFDENQDNRWNIDLDWESRLSFIINKYFSTTLYIRLIYDYDVLFPEMETIDGIDTIVGESPKLQLNESFGVGLSFKF